MSAVSFKFSKSTETRKLHQKSVAAHLEDEDTAEKEAAALVTHVENHKLQGSSIVDIDHDAPLVIPMITTNQWRLNGERASDHKPTDEATTEKSSQSKDGDYLDQEARAALLQDAEIAKANGVLSPDGDHPASIPILMKNRVPLGFETDEKLDVSLRPDEAVETDYETVPIEAYGMAMLRGMGWKQGQPIGRTNKVVVTQKIPELRPKGLGLGADRSLTAQLKKTTGGGSGENKERNGDEKQQKNQELIMRIGGAVRLTNGPHRENYGKIESFDEDNARLIVRLALGNHVVTVSQYGVQMVTEKEYEKEGKCINKSKYDRYKAEQQKQFADHKIEEDPLAFNGDASAFSNKRPKDSIKKHKRKHKEHKRRHRSKSPGSNSKRNPKPVARDHWVRSDLRVRIVDKQFADGQFFKTKMKVIDASSPDFITCRTDEGRLVEGLTESMLETVIPRSEPHHVMLVRSGGRHSGQVGIILKQDKRRLVATVQLLKDPEILLDMSFDDICEFVGDLPDEQ